MIQRVRQKVGKWIRRDAVEAPPETLLFTDHEEIQDIARQMARTKVELDRSVLTLRSWARDLGRRLADSRGGLGRTDELRALGETVGGLAHNFNNSLAAILAYTELMIRETQGDGARRRLSLIRDVALEASATVRRLQEFVSSQPQYSIIARRHEPEVFPLCAKNGIGQIVWSPLAQGILTGKYKRGAPQYKVKKKEDNGNHHNLPQHIRNHVKKTLKLKA